MAYSLGELQEGNISYELEGIDRMYLNGYVPKLSSAAGVAGYIRFYKGCRFASTKDVVGMTSRFVSNILGLAKQQQIPVYRFSKGERKDDVMHRYLKDYEQSQGVVFIGTQENAHRRIVVSGAQVAVVPTDIRVELADVLVGELFQLQIDQHMALQDAVIKHQVDEVVRVANQDASLTGFETKAPA